ncbi:hypothetical protein V6Z12_D13G207200 [Gossypium hirsutum]
MALLRGRTASLNLFNRLLHQSFRAPNRNLSSVAADVHNQSTIENMKRDLLNLDINSQIGSCGKLVRAAGTSAKILKEPKSRYCLIRLPSGAEKLIDTRCRATVGTVSNPSHGAKKLRKAGQSRWLGRRPVVRGVAMNPVDHPHGGGEGRSKSSGSYGKGSRTPWGKPCKCGFKTAKNRRRN